MNRVEVEMYVKNEGKNKGSKTKDEAQTIDTKAKSKRKHCNYKNMQLQKNQRTIWQQTNTRTTRK